MKSQFGQFFRVDKQLYLMALTVPTVVDVDVAVPDVAQGLGSWPSISSSQLLKVPESFLASSVMVTVQSPDELRPSNALKAWAGEKLEDEVRVLQSRVVPPSSKVASMSS